MKTIEEGLKDGSIWGNVSRIKGDVSDIKGDVLDIKG
jgi:hypothetical protein